ncbi:MAG: DUF4347 domain-containing protein [Deltaproteobacteria bacterium]|nr:DUF4347 domain-containing protein [Deltaproteobacteria bacterium]MBI3296108.1 DUF4347 domain-containing protein [Deltaproteobacteria bacterium]
MRRGLRQFVFILAGGLLLACAHKPASCSTGGFGGGRDGGGGLSHISDGDERDGKGLGELARELSRKRSGLPDDDGGGSHLLGDTTALGADEDGGGRIPGEIAPRADGADVRSIKLSAGTEFLRPLLTDKKHTAATISTDNSNAAMEYQNQYMHNLGIPNIMRHSTPQGVLKNVASLPPGTTTLIIGSHGSPGQSTFMQYWDDKSIEAFGEVARAAGLQNIILTSCSSGAGDQGRQLLEKIAKASGANVYAWDIILGASPGSLSNYYQQNGDLIVATPKWKNWDPGDGQYAYRHDPNTERHTPGEKTNPETGRTAHRDAEVL